MVDIPKPTDSKYVIVDRSTAGKQASADQYYEDQLTHKTLSAVAIMKNKDGSGAAGSSKNGKGKKMRPATDEHATCCCFFGRSTKRSKKHRGKEGLDTDAPDRDHPLIGSQA